MREMDGGRMDEGKEVNERGGQGVRSWGEKGGGAYLSIMEGEEANGLVSYVCVYACLRWRKGGAWVVGWMC